jgi:hypothetical protein
MRYRLLLLLLCVFARPVLAQSAEPRDSGWAVGVGSAGRIVGLTVKHPIGHQLTAQVFAGTFRSSGYGVDLDVLRSMSRLASASVGTLDFALGVGIGASQYYNSQNRAYFDTPVSVVAEFQWQFRALPQLELIASLRPTVARKVYSADFGFEPLLAGAIRLWL